jgi:hypothetical protein
MDWMVTWTGIGACAAVVASAVALVVAGRSWNASKGAVDAAATAARHALAAENTADASAGMVGELRRLADQQMPSPLTLTAGVLRNVSGNAVTIVAVENAGEFEGGPLPIVVPLRLETGDPWRIDLGQRYSDSARPERLIVSIEGRAAPITLELKTPGEVWFF